VTGSISRRAVWTAGTSIAIALLFFTARAEAFLAWTDAGDADTGGTHVARVHRDGSDPQYFYIPTGRSNQASKGVAIHGDFVYWTNINPDAIGRAKLDGSGADPNFIRLGGGNATSVAVDDSHIYWANKRGGTIGRASLDGTDVDPFFIVTPYNSATRAGQPVPGPYGVGLDANYVYWTNTAPSGEGMIGRLALNGRTPPSQRFIAGLDRPAGIAIGPRHIYWANNSDTASGSIGRADLNGQGVNASFLPLDSASPVGVAIGANHIYWTALSLPSFNPIIGRARKDGTNVKPNLVPQAEPVSGIAVTPIGY